LDIVRRQLVAVAVVPKLVAVVADGWERLVGTAVPDEHIAARPICSSGTG